MPDEDFIDVVVNVTLSPFEQRGCVLVPIIPDDIPEDSEFFIVSIAGVSSRLDVDIQHNNVTVFIRGIILFQNTSLRLGNGYRTENTHDAVSSPTN